MNHAFTSTFLNARICGYCRSGPFDTVAAVRSHLENSQHGFHVCCGRLYAGEEELRQHCDSRKRKQHARISVF